MESSDIREQCRHLAKNCTRRCISRSVTVNNNVGDGVINDEMNDAERCQTCCGNLAETVSASCVHEFNKSVKSVIIPANIRHNFSWKCCCSD